MVHIVDISFATVSFILLFIVLLRQFKEVVEKNELTLLRILLLLTVVGAFISNVAGLYFALSNGGYFQSVFSLATLSLIANLGRFLLSLSLFLIYLQGG